MIPNTFSPSRFIATPDRAAQLDPSKVVFGYGRRICPGMHLADVSLFLNIAGILATFDISKALDEHGKDVEPLVEYTNSVVSHLKPFKPYSASLAREPFHAGPSIIVRSGHT
ncbi:hypothetical protein K503DRAFT_600754 [Rhizopogon vinicolor AM-OR11-026]|uniref:Cytochrome P450 n=1 Tax=Rhizopogon vinicolor AM-OR11-026 TaxID=1314800 RepID=A0A1B7MIV3_9AGAM|nr:hypothetical protein K503DRAFT_600754 [Rhizopogon vinicolor AM-OR11-026]